MDDTLLPVVLTVLIAVAVAASMIILSYLLGRPRRSTVDTTPYECGMTPKDRLSRHRFSVKFYLVAMLFILFDIEAAFMIPWAVTFKGFDAARLFAQTKPAALQWGISIEHSCNCTDANRILNDMMAISGNLDVPGGNCLFVPPKIKEFAEYTGVRELPREQSKKFLGADRFKMSWRTGVVTPKLVWDAILTGKPYKVRALQIHGSNPICTRANAREAAAGWGRVNRIPFLLPRRRGTCTPLRFAKSITSASRPSSLPMPLAISGQRSRSGRRSSSRWAESTTSRS